jgi:hypothetical protein
MNPTKPVECHVEIPEGASGARVRFWLLNREGERVAETFVDVRLNS